MDPIEGCRFRCDGTEALVEGPPGALRELAAVLRRAGDRVAVPHPSGITLEQRRTGSALRVTVVGDTLCVSGSADTLDSWWSALERVADESESIGWAPINRHVHLDYVGDDEYVAPDSVPLVVTADWPETGR